MSDIKPFDLQTRVESLRDLLLLEVLTGLERNMRSSSVFAFQRGTTLAKHGGRMTPYR
jgi:hypothetical protein